MTNLRELVEAGRRHFESRNFVRAEQYFLKILRTGSPYADVLNMLGVIYHSVGKFNDAIKCFRKALQINPNYMEASLNLAVLYNDLGEYKDSRALYQRIQKKKSPARGMNPILRGKIANMHAQVGDTYSGIGRVEEAIDEYKKALALCPTYKDIKTKLGTCYRENKQNSLAVKELTETTRLHPNYLPARIQLGLAYFTQGEKIKASREWGAVLKKDKKNELTKMYLRICGNHK